MGVLGKSGRWRHGLLGLGVLVLLAGGAWIIQQGASDDSEALFGAPVSMTSDPLEAPPAAPTPSEKGEPPAAEAEAAPPPRTLDRQPPEETRRVVEPPRPVTTQVQPPAQPRVTREAIPVEGPADLGANAIEQTGRILADATGGMSRVPEATVWIGSAVSWVESMAAQSRVTVPSGFEYEAPRHQIRQPEFLIDRYEVSNEQYRIFLEDEGRIELEARYGTTFKAAVEELWPRLRHRASNLDKRRVTEQFYLANLDTITGATGIQPLYRSGQLALARSLRDILDANFKDDARLFFYHRAPPDYWDGLRYPRGTAADPVHGLSQVEALAFARWAGKYLPLEKEWEVAATAVPTRAWPWGSKPIGFEERVNAGRRYQHDPLMNVTSLPRGASAHGCHHVLGNVAEWTGSLLRRYPTGEVIRSGRLPFVAVRGGSCMDDNRLLLNPRARGWRTAPSPYQRIPYVGLRCAARTDHVTTRALMLSSLAETRLLVPVGGVNPLHAAGIATRRWVPPGQPAESAAFVKERNPAFIVVPAQQVLDIHIASPEQNIFEGGAALTTAGQLASLPRMLLVGLIDFDADLRGYMGDLGEGSRVPRTIVDIPSGSYALLIERGVLRLQSLNPGAGTPHAHYYVSRKGLRSRDVSFLDATSRGGGAPEAHATAEFKHDRGVFAFVLHVPLAGVGSEGQTRVLRLNYQLEFRRDSVKALDIERGATPRK